MPLPRVLALFLSLMLLGGCLYQARERVDSGVCSLAARPYDDYPTLPSGRETADSAIIGAEARKPRPIGETDIQATAFMQADKPVPNTGAPPEIPSEIPGSETRHILLPNDPAARKRTIRRIYPKLPPLPTEPKPVPGPDGNAYTLASLQQLAATNSPQLRQAAADVEAAQGNLDQARAYPNPTVSLQQQPSNDGSTAGVWGVGFDQLIKTFGKLRLSGAAAQMDLRNAELALRRARSDLSTQVRNAYFGHLVAKETMRVNRALAHFTDEVYHLQIGYLKGGPAAAYEPSALRALAWTARLSYAQSIATYNFSWKQLVAVLGLRQLPLSAVGGRIDAAIPYYDYDVVLSHVLRNHSDVLTARNSLDKARNNLKLAQITPFPDVDFNVAVLKESSLAPKQWVHTLSVGIPLPIWDRNKGNIIAAEAALIRATEEPHRVEENLTNTLATAYMNYQTSLEALEHYRRYILPDQVRTYRGAFERRQIDPNAALADLVGAQQTLAADIANYLTVLGQLWTSVVSVSDLLQTDDLFQLAKRRSIPPLPELEEAAAWPCCHSCPTAEIGDSLHCISCAPTPAPAPMPDVKIVTPPKAEEGEVLRFIKQPVTNTGDMTQRLPQGKIALEPGEKPADEQQEMPRALPAELIQPESKADKTDVAPPASRSPAHTAVLRTEEGPVLFPPEGN